MWRHSVFSDCNASNELLESIKIVKTYHLLVQAKCSLFVKSSPWIPGSSFGSGQRTRRGRGWRRQSRRWRQWPQVLENRKHQERHEHLFDLISVAILVWSQKGVSLKLIMTKPDMLFSMIRLEALLVDLAWEANSIRQGHCLRYHCWIANEDWAMYTMFGRSLLKYMLQ